MTTVYGVTFIGARAQIEKQLRISNDLTREQLWDMSTYMARAVRVPSLSRQSCCALLSVTNTLTDVALLLLRRLSAALLISSLAPKQFKTGFPLLPASLLNQYLQTGSTKLLLVLGPIPKILNPL